MFDVCPFFPVGVQGSGINRGRQYVLSIKCGDVPYIEIFSENDNFLHILQLWSNYIYIDSTLQPISGSKSQSVSQRVKRNQKNGSVTARCRVSDLATPTKIHAALRVSYQTKAKIVGYAPQK